MKIKKLILTAVFVILGFSGVVVSEAATLAEYTPLTPGSYWTYQNVAIPNDTYTASVFESFFFAGHPAVKYGKDSTNYGIGYNDGATVSLYADVQGGILHNSTDVSIGTITDGMFYQFGQPSNFQLIRMWDNLDSFQKSVYNIDPTLKNLILIAAYDSNFSGNSQNAIVKSNLGISLPDYAVTHLEWWQSGVGMIIETDIVASDGAIGNRYDLIDYHIAQNPVPIPPSLLLFGSSIVGLIGIRKRLRRNGRS